MELSRKAKAFRRKILTDTKVRQAARLFKEVMEEPFLNAMSQCGLSIADGLRFMAVAARLVEAREANGLWLKALAKQLGAPQYRVAQIERGNTKRVDASVLARYIDMMKLRAWFRRWESANPTLAKRLVVSKAGNASVGAPLRIR